MVMPNIAKKSDWKTKSMPKACKAISLNVSFSTEEYKKLQTGILPHHMEDRWFIYFKNNNLYFHRSWTGICIYIGKFKEINNEHYLYEIEINNNKKQYEPQSDYHEIKSFSQLIESIYFDIGGNIAKPITLKGSLEAIESKYCSYYREMPFVLDQLYKELLNKYKLKLNGNSITKAIILRLKTYYETQDKIAKFLDKKTVSPASDFFVETVAFYLKLLLEQRKKDISVKSEVRFNTKNGYIKPDISIWQGDKVLAIIECKTNLGFARKRWEADFIKREKELNTAFPKAKAYLLVLSSRNWSGFNSKDPRVNSQFFALSNTGLRAIKNTQLDNVIENRIEKLFTQIIKNGK